jgi:hypothetical protein
VGGYKWKNFLYAGRPTARFEEIMPVPREGVAAGFGAERVYGVYQDIFKFNYKC